MRGSTYTYFPKKPVLVTPFQYYAKTIYPRLQKKREEIYLSAPAQSGELVEALFRRMPGKLSMETKRTMAFQLNKKIAEWLTLQIKKCFPQKRFTLPHRSPQRDSWSEYDFNEFWLYYISGVNPKTIEDFVCPKSERPSSLRRDYFGNLRIPSKERIKHYQKLLESFLNCLNKKNKTAVINPIPVMVMMLGHEKSLGCQMENALAKEMGVTIKEIALDASFKKAEVFLNRRLQRILKSFGSCHPFLESNFRLPVRQIKGDGGALITLADC